LIRTLRIKESEPVTDSIRNLLAAILEALVIPHPATVGDAEQHARILVDRAMHAVIALRDVLEGEPLLGVEWTTAYLREQLAATPATGYRAWGASSERRACGRRPPYGARRRDLV
jgi:hypothetical protein